MTVNIFVQLLKEARVKKFSAILRLFGFIVFTYLFIFVLRLVAICCEVKITKKQLTTDN